MRGEIIPKGGHTRLGITSLVLGVIAFFSDFLGLFFGLPAIIFGYISYFNRSKDSFGLAGFILGFIGVIYSILILIAASQMR